MMRAPASSPRMAIACGGTGGHLFPGLAVAERLRARGCRITLFISQKEIDREGARQAAGMEVVELPAVGLQRGEVTAFLGGFYRAWRQARRVFAGDAPAAALAMGGFTSAPPLLAARQAGARTFLHEANTIPGRANRWLSRIVDGAFVGFPETAARLHTRRVAVCGTPVRAQFQQPAPGDPWAEFGLDRRSPVLLIMGGSQGARGVNDLLVRSLPWLRRGRPDLQYLHIAGSADFETVRAAHAGPGTRASVHPFLRSIDQALRAATVAVGRAGASSLAEIAAIGTPSLLVPFPAATDNHQWHNARAYETTGAARLLEQGSTTPEAFADAILGLINDEPARSRMTAALQRWHFPRSADEIAESLLRQTLPERSTVETAAASREAGVPGNPDSWKSTLQADTNIA